MHFISQLNNWLIALIVDFGYVGIFLGMFLESTIVPIPSELVMIPAGMAVANNNLDFFLVLFAGLAGNVLGAIFSYYIAFYFGRLFLLKVGRYFFVKASSVAKIESFFAKYGEISVFIGRLLPGFRHFISIPAGIAKMSIIKFVVYTFLGSLIWTTILVIVGYYFGNNWHNLHFKEILLIVLFVLLLFYFFKNRKSKKI